MKTSDFDYRYPETLVGLGTSAQGPDSRLLCVSRSRNEISHHQVGDLTELLSSSDVLVINTTKVIPARFKMRKLSGELLEGLWVGSRESEPLCWLKGKLKAGDRLQFDQLGEIKIKERSGREALLETSLPSFVQWLKKNGLPPLPPYIRQARQAQNLEESFLSDSEYYQSIFAKSENGYSVAAPTASLHFNEALFDQLKAKGVEVLEVVLNVGIGTFAGIEVEDISEHQMHAEMVEISPDVWRQIKQKREAGSKIVALGTTAMRALESAAALPDEKLLESSFETRLFISPGFQFQIVDKLITNFHQPRSSLLVLVASFMEPGKESLEGNWRRAYNEAIERSYRLFSFGDAMLIE